MKQNPQRTWLHRLRFALRHYDVLMALVFLFVCLFLILEPDNFSIHKYFLQHNIVLIIVFFYRQHL